MTKAINYLKQLFDDKQTRIQAVIALFVLAVGFIVSIAGFIELQTVASERLYIQTQQRVETQLEKVQTNITLSLDSLTDIAALYHAAGDVSRQQLSRYVVADTKYHSGTEALGWVPRVTGNEVGNFEAEMQKADPNFYIYEVQGHGMPSPVNRKKVVFPIKVIISPDNEKMTAGLNLASIASRQRVMNKAERLQQTAITQRIMIYSAEQRLYGFQAYHPVFNLNDWEQKQLAGFILGVYSIKALIEDVFPPSNMTTDIAVYDANTSNQQLLYSSTETLTTVDDVKNRRGQHWTYTLSVADQQWLMLVYPNPKVLEGNISWLPYMGLMAGGLITLLLVLYLFISLSRARKMVQLSRDLAGTTTQLDLQTKLKKEADKANRAKSGLLTAASHDLRQPLHTIGLLTTLLKDSKNEAEQTKLTDNILAAVEGMNSMFISLLDISLLESNQLPIHIKHFYLQDIMDKLRLDFTLQAKEQELDFSVVETSACVKTDPILLERILRNLLSNAFRYTPKGKILLGCRRLENTIRVCVLDTGIGLTQQAQERVFETFYRDKEAKQLSDKGLGLGLAIVQQAAELLELNTGMKSELAKGALFYVDVPYGEPTAIGEVQQIKTQSTINKRIWVIEDDEVMRDGLASILQSWQCDVEVLGSSKDVDELLNKNQPCPDIIIADYQMINETGLDLLLKIRTHYQHTIPAVMITGTTNLAIRNKIEQADCQFMMKPVKPEALNQILYEIDNT